MILPIQTALERVPKSLLEASSDLGAKPSQTFRNVILPLAFPGVVAGSIFTFSLTLGDFIVPQSLGTSQLLHWAGSLFPSRHGGEYSAGGRLHDGTNRHHGRLSA